MDSSSEPLTIRLVVIGDGSVGKTCMLLSYTTDRFSTDYVPTVFENYITSVKVQGKSVNLNLWDTAGQETYNQLRTLSYNQADIFLIVFSVIEKPSFDNVINKWFPELSAQELSNTPKIVVGNNIDCRNSSNETHIQQDAAKNILTQQNLQYMECSALTQDGLKEVFDAAVRLGYEYKIRQPSQGKSQSKDQPLNEKHESGCCCSVM